MTLRLIPVSILTVAWVTVTSRRDLGVIEGELVVYAAAAAILRYVSSHLVEMRERERCTWWFIPLKLVSILVIGCYRWMNLLIPLVTRDS